MVFPINTAPEIAPSRFAFGDTVIGETIDPVVDADWFYVQGEANQVVTAVVEPLGVPVGGGVTLYVENPATEQLLRLVPAAIGDSLMTTGPLTLPATRDYRFVVRSTTIGSHPRHRGSYRFWSHVIHPAPEHLAAEVPDKSRCAARESITPTMSTNSRFETRWARSSMPSWRARGRSCCW